jgi:hypothetical protein
MGDGSAGLRGPGSNYSSHGWAMEWPTKGRQVNGSGEKTQALRVLGEAREGYAERGKNELSHVSVLAQNPMDQRR